MPSSQISARELYHGARRGLCDPFGKHNLRPVDKTDYYRWVRNTGQVRMAACSGLGIARLPHGTGKILPLVDRTLRARYAALTTKPMTLRERLTAYLRREFLAEADRRGLPTFLDLAKNADKELQIWEQTKASGYHVMLLGADGFAKYSSRIGTYPASLALLCGQDDAGLWAVRVPATIRTVEAALEWLKPAEVRKAEEAGKTVLRQGDVWIVERTRDAMARSELPEGHRWDAARRCLLHQGHQEVQVPFPAIAIRQSTIAENGVGRRRGD
jgi:hypothetical protein